MPGCLRFLSSLPDAQFSVIIYILSDYSKRQWEDDELINKIGFSKDDQIGFMKQKSIDLGNKGKVGPTGIAHASTEENQAEAGT